MIRDTIIDYLKRVDRQGIDELINHLDEINFFTAPASSRHHLCHEGGLAEHSLNVYQLMCRIAGNIPNDLSWESLIITGLLHDVGKANFYNKPLYVPNLLKNGQPSATKPYEHNKERLIQNHSVASVVIISQFIPLTEEEAFAIIYHNGMYDSLGREVSGKETQLQQLLHFADMWCSRFTEGSETTPCI